MKNYKLMALFVLALLVAKVVSAETKSCLTADDHESFTYLLIDRSDKLEDVQGFEQSLQAVKAMIKPGERLLVGVSTGQGGDTRILMDLTLPVESIWTSPMKIRAGKKLFLDCLELVKHDLVAASEEYKHSALLETLGFVSKIFASDQSANKRLIMYSDMQQNSLAISFYSYKSLAPEIILKSIEKAHLFYSFKDVSILIAGTGHNVTDQRARELEDLWRAYFIKAQAQIKSYGPILMVM